MAENGPMNSENSATRAETAEALARRFLTYSAVTSQSDAAQTTVPTTEGQRTLATLLASELHKAGAADVHVSDTAVLTARVPANLPAGHPAVPAVGFVAHLDTVDVDLSPHVHAHVVDYAGGDLCLSAQNDAWIREAEHPELARYAGQRILVADGTSVLGADDKAGITVLMETALRLLAAAKSDADAPAHGDVYLAFVPDEEIGLRGVRTLELERFPVRYAYTVDGGELGEVVAETFNAASASVRIRGVAAHPISAKGVLVNPILVAHDLIGRFDRTQTPEHTEGREGYVWVNGIEGNQSTASVTIAIRDHDLAGYERRKDEVRAAVEAVRAEHPRAKIELEIEDVYGNIADAVTEENRAGIELMDAALARIGVEPVSEPMRGGTDGSWLSRQGILTPNLFTGGHNFHSTAEFLPLPAFERAFAMVNALIALVAREG